MLCPRVLHGKSSRDIFLHVVTPDRIPPFTIPSLDIYDKHRHSDKEKRQPARTARRSSLNPAAEDERSVPCSSSPYSDTGLTVTVQAIPDLAAWAALSLPHLPKVTTPYGFVTLGQSPQVTGEEALLSHSRSHYPRRSAAEIHPSSQQELGCCRRPGMPVAGGRGCSHTGGGPRDHEQLSHHETGHKAGGGNQAHRIPAGLPVARSASPLRHIQRMEVLESKEAAKRERRLLEVGYRRISSSLELPTETPRKSLLQRILRRYRAHSRQLKPTNFTLH